MKLIVLFFFFLSTLIAQNRTFSGVVKDGQNGEYMVGVKINISGTSISTVSNKQGFFSLKLPNENIQVQFSFGDQSQMIQIKGNEKPAFTVIELYQNKALDEVKIRAEQETTPGLKVINKAMIKAVTPLLGEVDPLKTLALIPGVAIGTEGTSGFQVRGGSNDQNLILLDEAPIYNVSHLAGFLSVFNANAVKSMDFYTGSFPAKYGGRLSSVVDIAVKDGNNKKFEGEYNFGLINNNLTLEGPIIREKASFLLSARYSNLGLTKLFGGNPDKMEGGRFNVYSFYDLNLKLNYQPSKKDHLYISFFSGNDQFKRGSWLPSIYESTSFKWGNNTLSARYTRAVNEKTFAKLMFIKNRFGNDLHFLNVIGFKTNTNPDTLFQNIGSSINDNTIKARVEYFKSNTSTYSFGIDFTHHTFIPNKFLGFSYGINKEILNRANIPILANEAAIYIENNLSIFEKLKINYGSRYVNYSVGKMYHSFEPRLSAKYLLNHNLSLNLGVTKMKQFIHLLTANSLGVGTDIWVPATANVSPQNAQQISLGLNQKLKKLSLNLNLEAYYKKMDNLIDYPLGNTNIFEFEKPWDQSILTNGNGYSKGIEFSISKETKNLNFWLAYTISKTQRQFSDINNGDWFSFKYDRTHVLNLTSTYKISKKWSASESFLFQSGALITAPVGAYFLPDGQTFPIYEGRNNFRVPNYHRADLSFSRSKNTKRGNVANLNFGFYNLYNRKNPFTVDVVKSQISNSEEYKYVLKSESLLPIIPFVSYGIKF